MGNVETEALVDKLAETLKVVETKKLKNKVGVVDAKALVDTLTDTLAKRRTAPLVRQWAM